MWFTSILPELPKILFWHLPVIRDIEFELNLGYVNMLPKFISFEYSYLFIHEFE